MVMETMECVRYVEIELLENITEPLHVTDAKDFLDDRLEKIRIIIVDSVEIVKSTKMVSLFIRGGWTT